MLSLFILLITFNIVICHGGFFEIYLSSSKSAVLSICLKQYQYSITRNDACVLGSSKISLSKEEEKNVRLPFARSWPENVTLLIDNISGDSERVALYTFRGAIPGGAHWTSTTISNSSIVLKYRVICPKNHYGAQCGRFCMDSVNAFESFTCNRLGNRVCNTGWTGVMCNIPVCAKGCANGGRCTAPDTCSCPLGFKGKNCEQCIPRTGCQQGSCEANQPFTCKCKEGWTGKRCDQDMYYCSRNSPCRNGGTCINGPALKLKRDKRSFSSYHCVCPTGFAGANCERSLTRHICPNNQVCLNGGSCSMENSKAVCSCLHGFLGDRCQHRRKEQQPITKTSTNLRSSYPASRSHNHLCKQTTCMNGGYCALGMSGQPKCHCPVCISGDRCEKVDASCLWSNSTLSGTRTHSSQDQQINTGTLLLLLGVLSLAGVLGCVLLGLCLIYRRVTTSRVMKEEISDQTSSESKNERVYKVPVTSAEPPPPYCQMNNYIAVPLDNQTWKDQNDENHRVETKGRTTEIV